MAAVPINLLYQINEILEKINALQQKIASKNSSLESLQIKNSKDEELYKQNQIEIQIQNKILEGFSKMQVQFLGIEMEMKLEIGKIIEKSINTFLTTANILKLIEIIKNQNPKIQMVIEADPQIASSLSLSQTKDSKAGSLRLIFDSKSYVLDMEILKQGLRKELLIKCLSQ